MDSFTRIVNGRVEGGMAVFHENASKLRTEVQGEIDLLDSELVNLKCKVVELESTVYH